MSLVGSEEEIGITNWTAASGAVAEGVNGRAQTPRRRVRDSLSQLWTGGRDGRPPTDLSARKPGETEPACAQWSGAFAQGIIQDDSEGSPGDELPKQPGPLRRKRASSFPPPGENRSVYGPCAYYGSRDPLHPSGPEFFKEDDAGASEANAPAMEAKEMGADEPSTTLGVGARIVDMPLHTSCARRARGRGMSKCSSSSLFGTMVYFPVGCGRRRRGAPAQMTCPSSDHFPMRW